MESLDAQSAPALSRGVALLRLLGDGEPRGLEALNRATGIPKSSLLRLLETLESLALVRRGEDRLYRAAARIVPVRGAEDFSRRVDGALRRLAEDTGYTAEWYVPGEAGLVLIRRAAPADGEVGVLARIGFLREWRGELEAVSALGRAHFRPGGSNAGYWRYERDGIPGKLSAEGAAEVVAAAAESGCAEDEHWNPHGVRRMAAVVTQDGRPVGVLALARHFTPAGRKNTQSDFRALRRQAARLSTNKQELPQ